MKRRAKRKRRGAPGAEHPTDDELLGEISAEARLFHTPSRESYATVVVGEHLENWPVRSREFRLWLTKRFFDERRRAPSQALLQETLYQLEARAQFGAREEEVHLRVAA